MGFYNENKGFALKSVKNKGENSTLPMFLA